MIRIPAVRFRQSDVTLYVGKIRAADLLEVGVIDSWDPNKGWDIQCQGYQRESYEKHYKAIAGFLRNNSDALLPTSVLLSARTSEQGILNFAVIDNAVDDSFGYLEVPKSYPLYIVDGQHRMQGLMHAIKELGQNNLQDFLLPVVVLYDASKVEELSQFHLVNDRQKRISTNLALALLGTVVEDQPNVAKILVGPKGAWKIRAIMIAITLNEGTEPDNLWVGRISLPNEPRGPTAAATLASFVNSIQPFFSGAYSRKLSNLQLREYLIKFWAALNAIMPRPFQSPRDYVTQRTTGVYSLNRVAAELARQRDVLNVSSQDIEPFLRADNIHMSDDMWISRGKLARDYRGHARFRDLADEILVAMGLEPSRPKK